MQERERRRVFCTPLYLKFAVPEAVLPEPLALPPEYVAPFLPVPEMLAFSTLATEPEMSKVAYSVAVPISVEP